MTATAHRFWTPAALARAAAGRWLTPPADADAPLAGINNDTRSIQPGQVYITIKGERFDGHDFVGQALAAGAAMAIVSDQNTKRKQVNESTGAQSLADASCSDKPVLLVDDTVAALQAIARAWRDVLRESGCTVIAVTGSNGKTTTRHLIWTVLSAKLTGTESPRSFNNHLGVPLTLLAAKPEHDFVVVEIGSNHPGEVAQLADLVRPDAAVVTSIGHEHMEFFGTLENVAAEEFSVLRFVKDDGLKLVPAEEAERLKPLRVEARPFDHDSAVPDDFPLPGAHNRRNAAAAAAVARWLGLDDATITDALRHATGVDGRMQRIELGRLAVLHDAYNANPSSMHEALHTFATMASGGRRVAILGDMFELGDEAPKLHRQTAAVILDLPGDPIAVVVTIGPLSMFIAEALLRAWPGERVHAFPQWTDDLPDRVAALLQPGDTVLLKASRGMKLERLLPAMETRFAGKAGKQKSSKTEN